MRVGVLLEVITVFGGVVGHCCGWGKVDDAQIVKNLEE